jgi:hypothetical protein
VLTYQCRREARLESRERFRVAWSHVVAYSVVWGVVGVVAAAAAGALVLWVVLLSNTAR